MIKFSKRTKRKDDNEPAVETGASLLTKGEVRQMMHDLSLCSGGYPKTRGIKEIIVDLRVLASHVSSLEIESLGEESPEAIRQRHELAVARRFLDIAIESFHGVELTLANANRSIVELASESEQEKRREEAIENGTVHPT